jgi:hypothetical protein
MTLSSCFFHVRPLSSVTPRYLTSLDTQQWIFLCKAFTKHFLATNLVDGDSSASVVRWLTFRSWTLTQLLNWTELPFIFRLSLCRTGLDLTEMTCHVSECMLIGPLPSTGHCADRIENTSSVARMRVYWPVAQDWKLREPRIKHFFQYIVYRCVRLFRALPRNGSTCHSIVFLGVPARLRQFLGFLAHILLTTSHTYTSPAGRGHQFLWTLFHLNCLHQLFILCSEDEVGLSVHLDSFSLSIDFGTFTYFVRKVMTDRCWDFKKSMLAHEMAHMSWCCLGMPEHIKTCFIPTRRWPHV